ncbi:dehydrogenase [Paraoerskovia sediminicola]|uniref:Dehydrogenase n=1 Tax=Paraoerskovia sediminicola TaxID=1138587 RepID=A0ABN6XD46_9CELL|nr:Gfo/Idh/MocA family oxidoreductase [Paraoerskovia sediminicola]BDZ41378.1 dehydrogenase [Paraoerskovia sediminicola]
MSQPTPSTLATAPGAAAEDGGSGTASRTRYAVVGTGHRAHMYVSALTGAHADRGEIVAWVEPNTVRAAFYEAEVAGAVGGAGGAGGAGEGATRPRYGADELVRAIREQRVDRVVVTSPDTTHVDHVCAALRAGVDVVVEKPLATTPEEARRIAEAVEETGRDLTMTFNYRYAPRNAALRDVIASGEIGRVLAVHFEWALDTVHGADYFRRWHREKDVSGGLLVHKSSHHFDLVNWWIDGVPTRVTAAGGRRFYGDDGAHAQGYEASSGESALRERGIDPWAMDLGSDPRLAAMYGAEAQAEDGYRRDRDVFDAGIELEDTLALLVEYEGGPVMTYSLVAHAPFEGYRVSVTGTQGRADLEVVERGSVEFDDSGRSILDPSATPAAWAGDDVRPFGERLVVQRHWERAQERVIPEGIGGHGGGDAFLLDDVFVGPPSDDRLGRAAGYLDGIRASAVGYAANRSLASGEPVAIADLGLGIDLGHGTDDSKERITA